MAQSISVIKCRSNQEIDAARELTWEFFDFLRGRYRDMLKIIDDFIVSSDVAGQLEKFSDYFLPPNGECFLGLQEKVVVGMVSLKPKGNADGELNRMYVRKAARGLGMGRSLGEAAIKEARLLGYDNLYLDALYRHVEALPLYESLGFERYSDANAVGGDDERVINMRLKL